MNSETLVFYNSCIAHFFNPLLETKKMSSILRIKDVISKTRLSRSSIYRLAKTGEFPAPVKLSERTSGWLESEINGWIDSRIEQRDRA